MEYIEGKRETFRVDFQKTYQPGDKIILDKVLSRDGSFGQPFLPLKLTAKVVKHGMGKKVVALKYKPKKRTKTKKGFRARYTLIEVTGVES